LSGQTSGTVAEHSLPADSRIPSPTIINDSATVLRTVTGIIRQNEETLRANRAWTDKLKKEYAAVNDELKATKKRYEATLREKETMKSRLDADKVASNNASDRKSIKGDKKKKQDLPKKQDEQVDLEKELSNMKRQLEAQVRENKRLKNVLQDCGKVPDVATLAQLRIQYEILLDEKKELCVNFEAEKNQLMKDLQELRASLGPEGVEVKCEKDVHETDSDLNADLSNALCRIQELSRQLMDVSSKYRTLQAENEEMKMQMQEHESSVNRGPKGSVTKLSDELILLVMLTWADGTAANYSHGDAKYFEKPDIDERPA
jgi:myosin heavy subunit